MPENPQESMDSLKIRELEARIADQQRAIDYQNTQIQKVLAQLDEERGSRTDLQSTLVLHTDDRSKHLPDKEKFDIDVPEWPHIWLKPETTTPEEGTQLDQFAVYEVDNTTLKFRGGVFQYQIREYDAGIYKDVHGKVEPSDGLTIKWPGPSGSQENLSDAHIVNGIEAFWLKLDRTSVVDVLTIERLGLAAKPTAERDVYWIHLVDVGPGIDNLDISTKHTGSPDEYLDPKAGSLTTILQPLTQAVASGDWNSHNDAELKTNRWRVFIDDDLTMIRIFYHEERYGSNGRLEFVGQETIAQTITIAEVELGGPIAWDSATGYLTQNKYNVKVLESTLTGAVSIAAADCPP